MMRQAMAPRLHLVHRYPARLRGIMDTRITCYVLCGVDTILKCCFNICSSVAQVSARPGEHVKVPVGGVSTLIPELVNYTSA